MVERGDLRRLLSDTTGIELTRGGVARCLDDVVERRLRELNCSESDYVRRAHDSTGREFELLTNAITVVYTWFFRDRGQMTAIESVLSQRRGLTGAPVRVWVPGCATGEDCFSIAMIAQRLNVPVSILGTDINTLALERARLGRYPKASMREVDPSMLQHFEWQRDGRFEVSESVRQNVQFAHHNLSTRAPEPAPGVGWDLVLCRNVLIYFKPERALAAFEGMAQSLAPGGVLLLGASEVVYDVPGDLRAIYHAGRLVLQRAPRDGSSARSGTVPVTLPRAPLKSLLPALPSAVAQLTAEREVRHDDAPVKVEHLERGHEQLDAGRIVEALEHYDRAVNSDPTWAEAHMYRGVARYLSGEVDDAAHDLRAALFLDPKLWQAAFYLALSYESMGLVDVALREYRHVVTLCERLGAPARTAHPLLVSWKGDVVELARRRLAGGGAASR